MKGVTVYKGEPHITSKDAGGMNCTLAGTGNYVSQVGHRFECEAITNNIVRMYSGEGLINGRHFRIPYNEYVDFNIDNGESGYQRNDLLCVRFSTTSSGIENIEPVVIKGTPGASAIDPQYSQGNVYQGDSLVDFPLYRVKIIGINITAIERLFFTLPSLSNFWPVGSIYMTVSPQNPSEFFGGTWVLWGNGRVPVGVDTTQTEFNTVEKTGGSKQLQEHYHQIKDQTHTDHLNVAIGAGEILGDVSLYNSTSDDYTEISGGGHSGNLQPYITCYMWKRTA